MTRRGLVRLLTAICLVPAAAQADWQAVEKVETYAITGSTGAELYASIGERGPVVRDDRRTIAYTNFKLTWSRKYERQGKACVLASARPNLTITYTLPKPKQKLAGRSSALWETFIAGIRDHEKVHGEMIKTLVRNIETATVGMTVADDPNCVRIKEELKSRLTEIFKAHQQKNRDFDKTEMSQGGNIHRLILELVNG